MPDGVDDLLADALAEGLRHVDRPLALAVELPGHGEHDQLDDVAGDRGIEAHLTTVKVRRQRHLRTVQQQPHHRRNELCLGIGDLVE